MYIALPLTLVLLLAYIEPSSASIFPRTSHAIGSAMARVHRVALRNTASLARDLRVAFKGVLVAQPSGNVLAAHHVYCTSSRSNSTSLAGGDRNNTSSTGPTGTTHPTAGSSSASVPAATVSPSPWKLAEAHQGTDFFSGWDFFTGGDPTHGVVQFVDQNTGQASNLSFVNSQGNAIMGVETTPHVQNTRQSIRITSHSSYDGGLFILDAVHMPTGCGTWPAFWTNGPNWPAGGEIDIVEGVNDYTNVQVTIHTNPGCGMPTSSSSALHISGTVVGGTDCSAAATGNQGCGVRASQTNSFGAAFNDNGGGVYAMKWDNTGISVFFFPRGSVPSDIPAGAPQPSSWGMPIANWPATTCDPFKYFNSHSVIFDTTLCGDWASGVWSGSGIPGQEQSCAQRTGYSTCEAFVQASGSSFKEAYWEVSSVKVYQLEG